MGSETLPSNWYISVQEHIYFTQEYVYFIVRKRFLLPSRKRFLLHDQECIYFIGSRKNIYTLWFRFLLPVTYLYILYRVGNVSFCLIHTFPVLLPVTYLFLLPVTYFPIRRKRNRKYNIVYPFTLGITGIIKTPLNDVRDRDDRTSTYKSSDIKLCDEKFYKHFISINTLSKIF